MTWLRAFEAAARHSSFSGAAAELNLTPAAVSQQIRLLEQHLGIQLFHRLPRGVSLTDMGQAYALPIRKSFTEMQDATESLFTVRRKRRVRIRASITYATLILAPRLKDFRRLFPDIEISLSTTVWSDRLDSESIDIDIRYGTGHWSEAGIRKLGEETATIVCHPDHLRRVGPAPRVQDLLAAGTVPVMGSEVEWSRLSDLFGLDCPAPPIWVKADSSLIALQTITAGVGTALIHENFARSFLQRGLLVSPYDYRLPIREAYYLVTRDAVSDRAEVEAFRNWLIDSCTAGTDPGGDVGTATGAVC